MGRRPEQIYCITADANRLFVEILNLRVSPRFALRSLITVRRGSAFAKSAWCAPAAQERLVSTSISYRSDDHALDRWSRGHRVPEEETTVFILLPRQACTWWRVSRSLLLGELLETRVRSELVKLAKKSQAGVLDPGAQSKDDDEVKNPSRAVAAVRPVSLSPHRSSTQAKHEQCPRVGASGELFTVAPSPHYP